MKENESNSQQNDMLQSGFQQPQGAQYHLPQEPQVVQYAPPQPHQSSQYNSPQQSQNMQYNQPKQSQNVVYGGFPQQTMSYGYQNPQIQNGSGGLAISALVLGIVGILGSWVPILNNFSALLGLVGAVLGIIAIATAKKKNRGKGIAVAGTILSSLTIVFVLITQSFYSSVLDEASQDYGAVISSDISQDEEVVASDEAGSDEAAIGDETRNNDEAMPSSESSELDPSNLAIGQAYSFNDVLISVDSCEGGYINFDGAHIYCVTVTYVNNSKYETSFNAFDWQLQDDSGVREMETYYSEAVNELGYGNLAPGGSVTRNLYFESDSAAKIVYEESLLSRSPDLIWNVS